LLAHQPRLVRTRSKRPSWRRLDVQYRETYSGIYFNDNKGSHGRTSNAYMALLSIRCSESDGLVFARVTRPLSKHRI